MHDLVVECPVRLTESNRDELRLLYADLRDHYSRRDARDGTRTTLHFVWSGDLDPELFTQLAREPFPLPKLVLKRKPDSLFDYRFEDFEVVGYESHPGIKAPVAV